MLLLLALVSAPPKVAKLQSIATVRIERPATAGPKSWAELPKWKRRETIMIDEYGRPVLLRLVENQ